MDKSFLFGVGEIKDLIKLSLITMIVCRHVISWADNGCVINTPTVYILFS